MRLGFLPLVRGEGRARLGLRISLNSKKLDLGWSESIKGQGLNLSFMGFFQERGI